MAKRFTDTDKWKKKWYRSLSNTNKVFWQLMLDHCNHAGIWDVDFEFAQIFCGELNEMEIREVFKKQYQEINQGKQWFIKDFLDFQYGELNPNNNLHKSVLNLLEKAGASQGLISPSSGAMVKVKDKVRVKEKEKDKEGHLKNEDFCVAFNEYLEMRQKIKKPATKRAEELILKKLNGIVDVNTAIAMLEQSIVNSWQDVYPLKVDFQQKVKTRHLGNEALEKMNQWEKEIEDVDIS